MTLLLTRDERRSLHRILKLLHVDKKGFLLSLGLGVIGLGSAIALAATSAWLIARASQQPPVLYLLVAATAVRLFGVLRALMRYLQRLASHRVALRGMDHLRQVLYQQLSEAPVNRVVHLQRGDLLARTGQDIDDVGDLIVKSILPACVTIIVGIATVAGIALLSLPSAVILGVCLIISGFVAPLLTARAARLAEEQSRKSRTDLSSSVVTLIEGASELEVQGRISELRRHINTVEDSLTHSAKRAARPASLAAAIDSLASGIAVLGALLIGIEQTTHGVIAAVTLAVVVLTPLASFEGTSQMAAAAVQLIRSAAAATRIDDLLGDDHIQHTHPIPSAPSLSESDVSYAPRLVARNLCIGWPQGPTLASGISFEFTVGSRIVISGPSGIGKSTLLYTLAGLLPPKSGTLTLDGVDIWQANREDITRRITLTTADAHIFATTVFENLRVAAPDLSRGRASELLGLVGLGSWLSMLPAGLDTLIGTGGTTVSGGERRRLLLARAFASPAALVLLDEPAEHLDSKTIDRLSDFLFSYEDHGGRGILVVSHHLDALHHADVMIHFSHDTRSDPSKISSPVVPTLTSSPRVTTGESKLDHKASHHHCSENMGTEDLR